MSKEVNKLGKSIRKKESKEVTKEKGRKEGKPTNTQFISTNKSGCITTLGARMGPVMHKLFNTATTLLTARICTLYTMSTATVQQA